MVETPTISNAGVYKYHHVFIISQWEIHFVNVTADVLAYAQESGCLSVIDYGDYCYAFLVCARHGAKHQLLAFCIVSRLQNSNRSFKSKHGTIFTVGYIENELNLCITES